MKIPEKLSEEFTDHRISIRHIKIFNEMEYRTGWTVPLQFEVRYFITGMKNGKVHILKESIDTFNVDFLELPSDQYDGVFEFMFLIKGILSNKISEIMGLKLEYSPTANQAESKGA